MNNQSWTPIVKVSNDRWHRQSTTDAQQPTIDNRQPTTTNFDRWHSINNLYELPTTMTNHHHTYMHKRTHCIKSELYLAKWKWILRSGPKLKMLVKFHCSNGSFPNLLNWWRIRVCCTALDQCYWYKENWFANWKSTMHFSLPPNIKEINSSVHTGRLELWSPDY
jgi:hypothetical protein